MNEEQRWIKRIQRRSDRAAAGELIAAYYNEMYGFIYKQTLNAELAKDLTQDTFGSMLQTIASYDSGKASFRTWLYRIATNRLVDYYRSRYYRTQKLHEPIEELELPGEEDFTISLTYREEVERVLEVVNRRAARSQQIFRLRLFADYPFQEIAALLDVPLSTVKTDYYATLRAVRRHFEEEENQHGT